MITHRVGSTLIAITEIASDLSDITHLLTDADLQQLHSITGTRRMHELAATLRLVRHTLGSDVTYSHASDGSPLIIGSDINISVSHSHTHAVIALDPHCRIGIDTETWRDQLLRVVTKFLSQQEQTVYHDPSLLLRAWTVKEAIYKAAGIRGLPLVEGIHLNLSDPYASIATVDTPEGKIRHFALHSIPSAAGSATTLAIPEQAI